MTISPDNCAELLRQQQNELDEHAVYAALAKLSRSASNAKILRKISAHERRHAGILAMIAAAVLIVAGYTYYISVAKDQPFAARFSKMLVVVAVVIAISFVLGKAVQQFVPMG